ncbi:hypothetical protein [Paracoccus onubensis]|uniref:Uncharacterized protein n=1 Tax=Paracoccus onubensis TaxID=1675788 RepID=A0A418T465_9RHOB|nr:hypothetical protein [Paracoccus onubensis]RJE87965.1 hypothetical protein D3P04_03325 [Paracoccus onubensis]
MPKLKALRGAIGSYGRVAAGGIIDVDEAVADKLIKTKRFVRATEKDIQAAQTAQKAALAVDTPGAGPGFLPMPKTPVAADRLTQMIERGEISRNKAKELVALEISLSTEEVQAFIKKEAEEVAAKIEAARDELDARAQALDKREHDLVEREKAVEASDGKAKEEAETTAEAGAAEEAKSDAATGAPAEAKTKAEPGAKAAKSSK